MSSESRIPATEVDIPPSRYPTPASMVEDLERMTPVTIGGPGWWIIDELLLTSPEVVMHRGQECYGVLPVPEWGTSIVRGQEYQDVRYVPVEDLWVYIDAEPTREPVTQIRPFDPLGWHDRLMKHPAEPPPRRSPRPARELTSLVGRTVRWRAASGEWRWLRLLSEPLLSGAEITVSACDPADYWRVIYHRTPSRAWVIQIPLHAAWTY